MGEPPGEMGRRIHRLRLARGLTQRDLAEPKYTAAYVSSVESGRRTPSSDALRHFAERLGVTEPELATGRVADSAVGLELALVEALTSREGLAAVADMAGQAGDSRRRAWALLALDSRAHLAEATRLLAGEPPPDRIPLVLAQAVQAEPRYAIHLLEEALDEMYREGFPHPDARFAIYAHLADRHLRMGDDDRAGAAAVAALDLAGPQDPSAVAADYLATARSLLAARRPADAAIALGQARAARFRAIFSAPLAACHRARGWMRRDAGELENAAEDLARARELSLGMETALDVAVELAEVHRRRGRPERAEAFLTEVLQGNDSPSADAPLRVARAYREWGLLAVDSGDDIAAEQRLRIALELHRHRGPRRELARTLRALGDLLCGQDRLAEAAEVLRSGLLDLETITHPS